MILYAKCENLDHLKDAAVDNRSPSATVKIGIFSNFFYGDTAIIHRGSAMIPTNNTRQKASRITNIPLPQMGNWKQ